MDRLGATQLDLLARHRARSLDLLLTASAAYRGGVRLRDTPDGKAILAQPPDMLVSIAISAAAAAVERRRLRERHGRPQGLRLRGGGHVPRRGALDAPETAPPVLARRRAAASRSRHVRARSRAADRAVARAVVLRRDRGRATSRRGDRIRLHPRRARARGAGNRGARGRADAAPAATLRRRIRALTATQVPGGLLDLLILDPRDAWAEPAKEILRTHAERWEGMQELVALLARARSTRPTERHGGARPPRSPHATTVSASCCGRSSSLSSGSISPRPASQARLHGFSRPTTRHSSGARSGRRPRSASRGSSRSSGSSLSGARRRRRTPR